MKLLTIAIPTFDRIDELKRLVNIILSERAQMDGFDKLCDVLVLDNGTDWQKEDEIRCKHEWRFINFIQHKVNIGADANIRECYKKSNSKYVWILGDDDFPRRGLIPSVLATLEDQKPDLLYIRAFWCAPEKSERKLESFSLLPESMAQEIDPELLALRYGSALMFISSVITNKSKFNEAKIEIDSLANTSLPHLCWTLPLLRSENKILFIKIPAIIATAFNSGGYSVLKVFADQYPIIYSNEKYLKNIQVRKALETELTLNFLPNVVRHIRGNRLGAFDFTETLPISNHLRANYYYKMTLWLDRKLPKETLLVYALFCKSIHRVYYMYKFVFHKLSPFPA